LYEIATGILRRNWYKKNFRMILFFQEPFTLITVNEAYEE